MCKFKQKEFNTIDQEEKYWSEDETLDEIYSENAEEEYKGGHTAESQGEEFYLEAV